MGEPAISTSPNLSQLNHQQQPTPLPPAEPLTAQLVEASHSLISFH